ncbi:hypothetical protein C8R44DRAFT_753192 [Mycena epipterygia]|nr:hypothetical protein C8R44DRAFT_753192 [Mycena epipterygia]
MGRLGVVPPFLDAIYVKSPQSIGQRAGIVQSIIEDTPRVERCRSVTGPRTMYPKVGEAEYSLNNQRQSGSSRKGKHRTKNLPPTLGAHVVFRFRDEVQNNAKGRWSSGEDQRWKKAEDQPYGNPSQNRSGDDLKVKSYSGGLREVFTQLAVNRSLELRLQESKQSSGWERICAAD